MANQFTIGVDFGTESGRAVLVSLEDGSEIVEHVTKYTHGVIDDQLPSTGEKLPSNWALQNPQDYIDVIKQSIPVVMKESDIHPDQVVGIGVDFTACTMLPVDIDGTPLCYKDAYKDKAHSWVKLWKHHGAQSEADIITKIGLEENQTFINRYGGKISSEWMFPKILETYKHQREVFDAADRFVEALDWVVFNLTQKWSKSSCAAGYKSMWHKETGFPKKAYLSQLGDGLTDLAETKLRGDILSSGSLAGNLSEEMSQELGLNPGIAVATGMIDAHASVPALGVVEPGKMVMAMGTSICHMILDKEEKLIQGISGVVEDGIIPGLYGYEAGQPAGGDALAWYVNQAAPAYIVKLAEERDCSIHEILEEKAGQLVPGQSGLIALDWWNGNRSTLVDANLTGMLVGLTLQTKPEEIYRALIESLAFGTKKIIETFEKNGIAVNELYACGGLAMKNKLLMQIYADITQKTIHVADTLQTAACGSAIYAAVAAGVYHDMESAAAKMARVSKTVYYPNENYRETYENIYKKYADLYEYFGQANKIMHELNNHKNGGSNYGSK